MTAISSVLHHIPGLVTRVALIGLAVAMVQPTMTLQRAPRHSWNRLEQPSGSGAQRLGVGGAGTDRSQLSGGPPASSRTDLDAGPTASGGAIATTAALPPHALDLLSAGISSGAEAPFGNHRPTPAFARPPPALT